jgi:uncharacterized membrane protein YesL
LARGNRPEGDGEQPLTLLNFPVQTLAATWDNLPQLLVGMLWLNLWLAPALLAAFLGFGFGAAVAGALLAVPGWVALQHFALTLVEGKVAPLSSLWGALRHFWRRGVRLGVIGVFLPVLTYLAATGARPPGSEGSAAAVGIYTVGMLGSLLVGSILIVYAVPLLVRYDQDLGTVVRNSLVLASGHITNTVGMVALAVLCTLAAVYLSSGLIFVLPTIYAMFVANHCRLVAQLHRE